MCRNAEVTNDVVSARLSIGNLASIPYLPKVSSVLQRKKQSLHFPGYPFINSFSLASATYIRFRRQTERRSYHSLEAVAARSVSKCEICRSFMVSSWEPLWLLVQTNIIGGSFMAALVDWRDFLASSYELLALASVNFVLEALLKVD